MKKEYIPFYEEIKKEIDSSKIYTEKIHRIAYGAEASFYTMIPEVVFKPTEEKEVQTIMRIARKYKLPYTFKAAGTSLSGQSITDSILIVSREGFEKIEISKDASKVTLGVGVIAGHANAKLLPFQKKIGPDPATVNQAMIGGIVNNNSSGMCCGVDKNSYKTIASMRITFADGTLLDTGDDKSRKAFEKSHGDLLKKIKALSERAKNNPELRERIARKYKIKNTTGYSVNALIDFDEPIDILEHLIVGSEGTLGYVSEVTYHTQEELLNKASSMIYFNNISDTCDAIMEIRKENDALKSKGGELVSAAELIDRNSLHSVENKAGMEHLKAFGDEVTALLVDVRGKDASQLDERIEKLKKIISKYSLAREMQVSKEGAEIAKMWSIRKGLLPAVGFVRKSGTSVIIEDVAFPYEKLKEGTLDLQKMLKEHNYFKDTLIFGHALDSNLHFVFSQSFSTQEEIDRYDRFMTDIVKLITEKYDGSLKAEHGTGRNMAPFVEKEWGKEVYEMMKEIKSVVDPENLVNPGVLINNDPKLHLKNLKKTPTVNDVIDRCIECGFCEHACPSKDITLTPRQRIIIAREMETLRLEGKNSEANALKKKYMYEGLDTCAKCGLCDIECPVDINTGNFIKMMEQERNTFVQNVTASVVANTLAPLSTVVEMALRSIEKKNKDKMPKSAKDYVIDSTPNEGMVPKWHPYFPTANTPNFKDFQGAQKPEVRDKKVVYFTTCMTRNLGVSQMHEDRRPLYEVVTNILKSQNYEVLIPKNVNSLCCGLAFASKGFKEQADAVNKQMMDVLMEVSENGKYPVLMDTSSCTHKSKESIGSNYPNLKIYDTVDFIHDVLLKEVTVKKKKGKVALHVTCSSKHMGMGDKMVSLAKACAEEVVVPMGVTCCGAAGDKWLRYPEFTAKSTRKLKPQVSSCDVGYSNNIGCQGNVSKNSGVNYYSLWHLLEEVIVSKK